MAGNDNIDELFNLRASFPNEEEKKAFFSAVRSNNINQLEKILEKWPEAAEKWRDSGKPPLVANYDRVNSETIDFLLKKGAKLNQTADDGSWTPLIMSAFLGTVKDVEKFIRAGAEIDGKDKANRTPLSMAVDQGHLETIDLLVLCGADPRHKGSWGKTIMEEAKTEEIRDVIRAAQSRREAFLRGERQRPATPAPDAPPPPEDSDEIKLLKRIELRKDGDRPTAAKKPWWKSLI